jgi:hypothetical protein
MMRESQVQIGNSGLYEKMMARHWSNMRTKAIRGFVALAGLLALSTPLAAHH